MKKIPSLGILLLLTSLLSCTPNGIQNTNDETVDTAFEEEHSSKNALDWQGLYDGVLPCADCSGIKMVLKLLNGNKYDLKRQYLGKSDQVIMLFGKFTWIDGNHIALPLGNNDSIKFKVIENALIQLDKKGKPIKGKLAEQYTLKKQL